jgi:dihydropteroate synthase
LLPPRKLYQLSLPSGRTLILGERTLVMGVVNVTPDSFADGGQHLTPGQAIDAALRMEDEGADIVDIGGESTRPGAEAVSLEEELRRVLPVVGGLRSRLSVPISIDTYKADVAKAVLGLGADIVNDISALRYDPGLASVVAETGAGLVLMHNRGRSRDMYQEAAYESVWGEVVGELGAAIAAATGAGVLDERLLIDPGLGFAKHAEHSYRALAHLDRLKSLDRPIVVGPSRKSFLQKAVGPAPPERREWGTAAAVAAAVLFGAHVVRVHDVGAMRDVVRTADEIRAARDQS